MFGKKKSSPEKRRAEITEALSAVRDPSRGKNVVELGAIKSLTVADDDIVLTLVVGRGDASEKVEIEALGALKRLGWPKNVKVSIAVEGGAASDPASAPAAHAAPAAPAQSGLKNIIAVASGKGGVGKSTVATNLALSLKGAGATVGLMDADIYGPSIPTMLGLADSRPEARKVDGRQIIDPIDLDGLKVMSMGFMVEAEKPMIWRGPMVHSAVTQFFRDVAWGELDYLVIDLPPGTGDVQLTMVQSVPVTGAVIVTTPQDVAMIDARKAFNMFKDTNVPILGIVENMSVFHCPNCGHEEHIFGQDGAKRWAEQTGADILGSIPLHISIREHGDAGLPAVADPNVDEAIVRAFQGVADAVQTRVAALAPKTQGLSLKNDQSFGV